MPGLARETPTLATGSAGEASLFHGTNTPSCGPDPSLEARRQSPELGAETKERCWRRPGRQPAVLDPASAGGAEGEVKPGSSPQAGVRFERRFPGAGCGVGARGAGQPRFRKSPASKGLRGKRREERKKPGALIIPYLFTTIPPTPLCRDGSTNAVRSRGSQAARPPSPRVLPSDPGPEGSSKPSFASPCLHGPTTVAQEVAESGLQTTWRQPTSAAGQGAQAGPHTAPPPRVPWPRACPSLGPQARQPPHAAAKAATPLGNLQVRRGGRCAGCRAFSTELPRCLASRPRPSRRPPANRRYVSAPTLRPAPLDIPRPRGVLGGTPRRRRPPEPRVSERCPRRPPTPGPRAFLPPGWAQREGLQAETAGTRRHPTLCAPAALRREPRAPNGRRTRPGAPPPAPERASAPPPPARRALAAARPTARTCTLLSRLPSIRA
ncbi:translation initiation factor IF-2-like [Orcinus orca]|uniref:translation initiation factor IF-2-like n=1 Tax=Orcinus orca TaxID=9733 RepID=UPI002112B616|nr:translation initiation factor IF-2-like [Orcinus orca]